MTQLVYRIKDLEAHPHGVDVAVPLDRAFLADMLRDIEADLDHSEAQVRAHLRYLRGNVQCRGAVTGHLRMTCQRCLQPATVPVDAPLNLIFVPPSTALPSVDDEEPFDPDDVDYAHHDRALVDLQEVVREQLLLGLPIKVLCREECRGLCPVCGGDRNCAPCNCEQVVSLSPFAALKNLKS